MYIKLYTISIKHHNFTSYIHIKYLSLRRILTHSQSHLTLINMNTTIDTTNKRNNVHMNMLHVITFFLGCIITFTSVVYSIAVCNMYMFIFAIITGLITYSIKELFLN